MKYEANNFINRELSWIDFNKRVLLTGMEKDYKVLDKINFFQFSVIILMNFLWLELHH